MGTKGRGTIAILAYMFSERIPPPGNFRAHSSCSGHIPN
jgi:hypothetical protein